MLIYNSTSSSWFLAADKCLGAKHGVNPRGENLHPRNFFGSRDLSRIFLGLKVCLIEVPSLVFFWVENFDARYFFGVKFQVRVFFWVRNMKLCRTPVMYAASTPPPPPGSQLSKFDGT